MRGPHPDRYEDADHLLLEMAAGEESTRPESYTRIGRGNEVELALELHQAGLIVQSQFQGFTTWLSDRGRLRAVELRVARGWAPHRLFCEGCEHGVLAHRGSNTVPGDVALSPGLKYDRDYRLEDGRDMWELHHACLEEGCDCEYCQIPWPEDAPGSGT